MSNHVILGMPLCHTMAFGAANAYFHPSANGLKVTPISADSSVLTANFNRLWSGALNARSMVGATHFAMLHSDVCPDLGFLDTLLAELEAHEADVVSAVVPIKNELGLTSTACGESDKVFEPLRRLTMQEVFELPETFGREDVDWPGLPVLYINTGCWIADIRKPWANKIVFRNVEGLGHTGGVYWTPALSEDWAFSVDAFDAGCKVLATRKVKLYHDNPIFTNRKPWGEWTRDEQYFERMEKRNAAATADYVQPPEPVACEG